MKILTCASYYGTGSSAIIDLLSEYSCYHSLSDYEFRFVQDPGGISDLEYNLVENHHRHNSGHALKRYKKNVDRLVGNKLIKRYAHFFGDHWKQCSYQYIDQLADFAYKGYWKQDIVDRGEAFVILSGVTGILLRGIKGRAEKNPPNPMLRNEITMFSEPSEEAFLTYTRDYIDALFASVNKDNKSAIVVDQIVPPSNLSRYIRYFNDIKVFIVDRDPRDIYLSERYIWKGKIIPVENPEIFCKWFKYTRQHRKKDLIPRDHVMYLQFEDLIYHYDETVLKIEGWLNLDPAHHKEKFKYLDPKVSIKNTRLWEKYPYCHEDIAYIERELTQYLYKEEMR